MDDRRNAWAALVMALLATYYSALFALFRWHNQGERVLANIALLAMLYVIASWLQWFV